MDLHLIAAFVFVCHTIAINIVQFRHRNDEASREKQKRKIVNGNVDWPLYIVKGGILKERD